MDKALAAVTRAMTRYARQAHAKDAQILDVHLDEATGQWKGMSRSRKEGFRELVAEKGEGQQWKVALAAEKGHPRAKGTVKLNPKDVERTRTYAHATFDSPLQILGKFVGMAAVLGVVAGLFVLAKPQVERIIARAKEATPPPTNLGTQLDNGMLDAAEKAANDPRARAAAEELVKRSLDKESAEAYQQLPQGH